MPHNRIHRNHKGFSTSCYEKIRPAQESVFFISRLTVFFPERGDKPSILILVNAILSQHKICSRFFLKIFNDFLSHNNGLLFSLHIHGTDTFSENKNNNTDQEYEYFPHKSPPWNKFSDTNNRLGAHIITAYCRLCIRQDANTITPVLAL